MNQIGITERGDAALDTSWLSWVGGGKPAILISKDPLKLYTILTNQNWLFDPNIIVHSTITGYGGTFLEPNVPKYQDAMLGFFNLVDRFPNRVVLRIDPIIPTDEGIKKAKEVLLLGSCKNTRVRISFIDCYTHIDTRFKKLNIKPLWAWGHLHAPIELRRKAWEELGKPEVCGEPGFECTGCVSEKDCEILKINPMNELKGQRQACACLMNKHELLMGKVPCFHNCIYCYYQ